MFYILICKIVIEKGITSVYRTLQRVTCLDCAYTRIAVRQSPKLCPRCRRASRWIACDVEEDQGERALPLLGWIGMMKNTWSA